jgi:ABC-type multidrug transport system fused ATPase/permease subunit
VSTPYKRSIFIVDPKFQLKFSLFMCFIIMISSMFYPLVIYQLFSSISERFPQSAGSLDDLKENLKMLLILWQLGFGIATFIIAVLFTHKVAGPMYKLKKYLAGLRNGTAEDKLYFRSGDYFKEVADEVNETVGFFQERFQEDSVYINETISYLKNLKQTVPDDKRVVIDEIVNKLSILEDRYDELIG